MACLDLQKLDWGGVEGSDHSLSPLSFQRWSLEAELLYLSGSGREHESSTQLPPASLQEELELSLNSTVISGIHKGTSRTKYTVGVSVVVTLVFHD